MNRSPIVPEARFSAKEKFSKTLKATVKDPAGRLMVRVGSKQKPLTRVPEGQSPSSLEARNVALIPVPENREM